MPQDQVLPYPVLAGGRDLDQAGTGILLSLTLPQRKGQEQGEFKACSAEVQHHQPIVYDYLRDL